MTGMADDDTIDISAFYTLERISHSPILVTELIPDDADEHFVVVLREDLVIVLHESRPIQPFLDIAQAGPKDRIFTIPAGFLFDGASVRYRYANAIMLRWGRNSTPAAAVHDWFYSDGRHLIPASIPKDQRRKWCDDLFLELLLAAGVGPVRARLAYRAVRIFGGEVWNRGTAIGYDKPEVTKWNHPAEE